MQGVCLRSPDCSCLEMLLAKVCRYEPVVLGGNVQSFPNVVGLIPEESLQ